MNILVTGANGQLGRSIRSLAGSSSGKDQYFFSDIIQAEGFQTLILDISDIDELRSAVALNHIDCIVNCAAFTNVDAAESNAELAEKLNAFAPRQLATVMQECGGLLVHISTDYVFGKHNYNTPCSETCQAAPSGVYGATKLKGEQNIINSGCKYIILRTSWLYSEYGKNFCKTILSLSSSRPELKVVIDQVGTPTYAPDLAQAIINIVENRLFEGNSGIYNYSNEGVCSWFDFATLIARYAGNSTCRILPCTSSQFPSPVVRPSYSVLDKTKIKETFGVKVPYWTDSLLKCVENLKKD